ncbi:Abscisic acid receptor PYL8 [Bienertia sinuspersici]
MGGDHRLRNYSSKISVHPRRSRGVGTLVIESFVVDVQTGNDRGTTTLLVPYHATTTA